MKEYIGVKKIKAEQCSKNKFLRSQGKLIGEDLNSELGYKVRYEDDYESWSPKDVFEKAYKESFDIFAAIPDLNEDALEHQERVFCEAVELRSKCIGLNKFVESANIFKSLANAEQIRLKQQLMAMKYYLTVLVERIGNF